MNGGEAVLQNGRAERSSFRHSLVGQKLRSEPQASSFSEKCSCKLTRIAETMARRGHQWDNKCSSRVYVHQAGFPGSRRPLSYVIMSCSVRIRYERLDCESESKKSDDTDHYQHGGHSKSSVARIIQVGHVNERCR
jgi:hypothetical protein